MEEEKFLEKDQFYSKSLGKYVKVITKHGSQHLGRMVYTSNASTTHLSPHLVNEMVDEGVGEYYINYDKDDPHRIDTMTIGSVQSIRKEYLENIVEHYKKKNKEIENKEQKC